MGFPEDFFFTPLKTTDVTWNFEKFLIDGNGQPVKRYEPGFNPDDVRPDIDELLAAQPKKQEKPVQPVHQKMRGRKMPSQT